MKTQLFSGPNLYSTKPVIACQMIFRSNHQVKTEAIHECLEIYFPGWLSECPYTEDLSPEHGTGLIIAFFSKALLNYRRGYITAAGAFTPKREVATIWVGYHDPELAIKAIKLTAEIVGAISSGSIAEKIKALMERIELFLQLCRAKHPDYIARILQIAADADHIPYYQPPDQKRYWRYGFGCNSKLFFEASPSSESWFGMGTAGNKVTTNDFLAGLGFPVSEHLTASNLNEALHHAETLGWPVVVKPIDCGQGRGVSVHVQSEGTLRYAFNTAQKFTTKSIIIERFIPGADYRLLVIRGKLISATRREPANVIGNGTSTIHELITELNQSRTLEPINARYLKQIKHTDEAILKHLASQELTLNSRPDSGHTISLRGNANISTGGNAIDATALVHPDIRRMAEAIALNLEIDSLGVDYITTDIKRSWHAVPGKIIEINTTPGLDLHVISGLSEINIGRTILGPQIKRVLTAVIVAPIEIQRSVMQFFSEHEQRLPNGLVLAGPDFSIQNNLQLARREKLIHQHFSSVMQNRTVTAAIGFITPDEVTHHGFLLDYSHFTLLSYAYHDYDQVPEITEPVSEKLIDMRFKDDSLFEDNIQDVTAKLLAFFAPTKSIKPANATPKPSAERKCKLFHARDMDLTIVKDIDISEGLTLFTLMKNESYLCPHFFEHYRNLGIENFIIYDDHSTDGTLAYLSKQPDCLILTSDHHFRGRLANGRPLHHHLRNVIPEALGNNRWVINVDADEFLFLPNGFTQIDQMYNWLDSHGYTCIDAAMVDFYPQFLSQRNYSPTISPFQVSSYFDTDKAYRRPTRQGERYVKTPGGVRSRLQQWLKDEHPRDYDRIYKERGYIMAATWKTPIIKTGTNTYYLNSHSTNKLPPPEAELALAHFKFTPSIDNVIDYALANNNYYHGSIEYRFLQAALRNFEDRDMLCHSSHKFKGAQSLQEAGFIRMASDLTT